MSATIKDIARIAGVSTSTVSRALRGHPDINKKTRNLVIQTATDLDYHPNTLAQNLNIRGGASDGALFQVNGV
jgi:LacI family transcriptional regulator